MSVLGLLCLVLACSDRLPTRALGAESAARSRLLLASPAASETGCARFAVRVSGRDRIEVVADTSASCGPVRPVLAGVPRFDNAKQTVRLPVALLNTGSRKWKAPARLYGWNDSLVVVAPAGLANTSKTYISFADPDSAVAADAVERAGAVLWRFDQHLAPEGQPQVLAGGDTSRVRWVELRVHPGVERFELVLHAEAKRAAPPVPAIPPNGIPYEILDSANIIRDSEIVGVQFVRDVLIVIFHPGTTQEQKEEAIGLVEGEVIGGIHHISKYEDLSFYEYVIQIPTDGTDTAIWNRKEVLKALPQVMGARLLHAKLSRPLYTRPTDGAGWEKTDWEVRPERAAGANWASEAVAAPLAWGCETVGYVDFPTACSSQQPHSAGQEPRAHPCSGHQSFEPTHSVRQLWSGETAAPAAGSVFNPVPPVRDEVSRADRTG